MTVRALIVVATLSCLTLAARARADAIGGCPHGQHFVSNPTPPGAMHHGGGHCEPGHGFGEMPETSSGTETHSGCAVECPPATGAAGATLAALGIAAALVLARRRNRTV